MGLKRNWSDRKGIKNTSAKLTEENVRDIRSRLKTGANKTHLAKEFGVTRMTIHNININKTWTHLS